MRAHFKSLFAIAAALSVAACGGGGQTNNGFMGPVTPLGSSGSTNNSAVPSHFTLIDLGTGVMPSRVNNHNVVVGTLNSNAVAYANGSLKQLGKLSGDVGSSASDINDAGIIIGTSYAGAPDYKKRAAEFSLNGAPQALSSDWSEGAGVNNAGQLIGTVFGAGGGCFGSLVMFDGHGGSQVLGSNASARGSAINAQGVTLFDNFVTGAGGPCSGQVSPTLYPGNAGVPLPANNSGGDNTEEAFDINDLGDVVGYYRAADAPQAGFYYHNGSSIELLPQNGQFVTPRAINNQEWIVGTFTTASVNNHAFIWSTGKFTDLNSLLPAGCGNWVLQEARDLNESGTIVGVGTLSRVQHGFMLMPQH